MRHLGKRRALSTIVTSAILLTATVLMGTGLVNWSNSNLKAFETALVTTSSNMTNQINEKLSIENVVFCVNCGTSGSKNVMNITLTNSGTVPVRVTQIQVNSTIIKSYYYSSSSPYFSSSCPTPSGSSQCLPAIIYPKGSYMVSAALTPPLKNWTSKIPDTITVMTARNSIFTTQAAPP